MNDRLRILNSIPFVLILENLFMINIFLLINNLGDKTNAIGLYITYIVVR